MDLNKKRKIEDSARMSKVEFVICTYPDLHPFLENAVHLLEDLYEYNRTISLQPVVEQKVIPKNKWYGLIDFIQTML